MQYPVSNPTVVFKDTRSAVMEITDLPRPQGDDYVLIRTEKSIVSAGTEIACFKGTESWAPFPFVPGYGSVGRVVDTGPAVTGFKRGDRVFTYGRHELYSLANTVTVPLSEELDAETGVFARIAAVSITARRVSDAAFGDPVLVLGLGLVGNLAAQIFKRSGAEVVAVDPSEKRRCLAAACGIQSVFASRDDLEREIDSLTDGKRFHTVVDATGIPAVIVEAPAMAGKGGEVILLGSPRGEFTADLTPLLNQVHLAGHGCITLKGAHEFRFPAQEDPGGNVRFSFTGNVKVLLRKIASGDLRVRDLISHRADPRDCDSVYSELHDKPDSFSAIVFDWSHFDEPNRPLRPCPTTSP